MFVSTAFAHTAEGSAGGMDIMGMLPLVLLFVLLYFLMIRPQAKKQKEHKATLDALQKGMRLLRVVVSWVRSPMLEISL